MSTNLEETIRQFYAKFNPEKVGSASKVVASAKENRFSDDDIWDMLYEKYNLRSVAKTAELGSSAAVLDKAALRFPSLSRSELASTLKENEWNGKSTFDELIQELSKKKEQQEATAEPPSGADRPRPIQGGGRLRADSVSKHLAHDQLMIDEARDWVVAVLDGCCPSELLERLKTAKDFVNELRDGAALVYLTAKLRNPDASLASVKKPRVGGFFSQDNISQFLILCKEEPFRVQEVLLFSSASLANATSDRQVITTLLALAKAAHAKGMFKHATPAVVRYETEIDQMAAQVTEDDVQGANVDDEDDDDGDERVDVCVTPPPEHISCVVAPAEDSANCGQSPPRQKDQMDNNDDDTPSPTKKSSQSAPIMSPAPDDDDSGIVHVDAPAPLVSPPKELPPPPPVDAKGPQRYRAKKNDAVDMAVGKSFNKFISDSGGAALPKLKRWRNSGEYIIVHPITGRKTLVYIRELRSSLMIRVGGGWELFSDYLKRRCVDYERAPTGTHQQRQMEEARARAE